MSARNFIDTNILVYANDRRYPEKQRQAAALVDAVFGDGSLVLSTQVLQEYFVTITGKLGVPAPRARDQVTMLQLANVIVITEQDVLAAIDLHQLRAYSFWACLIVRAALVGRCSVLYTEDLSHGQRIDGLTIVNPFVA